MSFRYREWVFEAYSGSIEISKVGLVGKNGCGKTTLLKLLDRQLKPQKGRIRVAGSTYMVDFDLSSYKAFWPDDVVELCSHLSSFDTTQADHVIDYLGLGDYIKTPIGELSKGTVKKVALLMGFMSTADVLLVDEPFESIDQESNSHLVMMLRQRQGSHVIVSHDEGILRQCVDTVYTITDRKLAESP
jgi:ATPase subunit of ABC transporter with duplicated ATPase domains